MIRLRLFFAISIILFSCSKKNSSPTPAPAPKPVPTITNFSPDSAAVGDSVVITGTNFIANVMASHVEFNGVPADAISASTTSLTVIVPAGATSGNITITTSDGTATSSKKFTVLTLTGSWIQKTDYGGSARYAAAGFSIGTKGYVFGGNSAADRESDFWEYDASTNQWTKKADFPATG